MDWITIIGLILLGTFLIISEIIFVPGTTIVGVLGFIFSIYGVYLGYDYFGMSTGTVLLRLNILVSKYTKQDDVLSASILKLCKMAEDQLVRNTCL